MFTKKNDPVKTLFHALLLGIFGAFLGMVTGLIFGLAIAAVSQLLAGVYNVDVANQVPLNFGAFVGMGAGTLVGGILGALIGKKKE